MTTIPDDIMAAAIRALMVPEHEMAESVSLAILAERERCASIAEGVEYTSIDGQTANEIQHRTWDEIAFAIRSQS